MIRLDCNVLSAQCCGVNQRMSQNPALNENHQLLEKILDSSNLKLAWKQVRSNKGAPGVDKITIADFPHINRTEWSNIQTNIEAGNYYPSPIKRLYRCCPR